MAGVTVDGVVKRFGDTQVLHGIDLEVGDGEFVSLLGPSGCGKSTLLRSIAGLEAIDDGDIRIGDRSMARVRPKDRNIAMVFQSYALYPHMSVRDNLAFGLRRRGERPEVIRERVASAASMLGLEPLLDRRPRQLSGGQRQRVAMGRAIVREPEAFLFDEPLSNLDAALRVQMRGELKLLRRRLGTTSIYVTHDQIEAMTLSDRVVVMREGRIEQIGRPLELFDAPVNRFVAQFIGHPAINLIEGEITDGTFRRRDLDVPAAMIRPGPALLAVRPQHVRLAKDDDGVEAAVLFTEPTGVDVFARFEGAFGTLDALIGERVELEAGDLVRLALDADRVHYFDRATDARL